MGKIINLIGKRFGRLVVVEFAGLDNGNGAKWKCICDCGNEKVVARGNLLSGGTLSCGCLNREKVKERMSGESSPAKRPEVRINMSLAHIGNKASEETRRKMSEQRRGEKHPMFGKHHTEESRKKNSDSHIGVKLSDEHKEKISISCKGINFGKKNGMFGKFGEENPFYGKKHTKESLLKISENRKGKYCGKENNRYGKPPAKGTGCGKGSYIIRQQDNKCIYLRSTYETRFAKELESRCIIWEYEKKFKCGSITYRPDFYLPEYNLYIEVKGYLSESALDKLMEFYIVYPNIQLKMIELPDIKNFEIGKSVYDIGTILSEYLLRKGRCKDVDH